jgi:hypothetical protein
MRSGRRDRRRQGLGHRLAIVATEAVFTGVRLFAKAERRFDNKT